MNKSLFYFLVSISPTVIAEGYWQNLDHELYSVSAAETEVAIVKPVTPMSWLLSGQVNSRLDSGMYSIQYQNVAPGWDGKKWAKGLRLVLGIEIADDVNNNGVGFNQQDLSVLDAFNKKNDNSGALFFMSIEKTWH